MAKVKCKGTKIQQTIASVLTDVAQVISMEQTGSQSETYDATTLDTSGAGKEYSQTGYSEGGTVNFELFYDPALAGHQAITDLITTPAACAWKIKFADTAVTEQAFSGAGVGFDQKVDMNDGLKGSVSIKVTGIPTFPT